MRAARPAVSERRACRVLGVARSALHAPPRPRRDPECDAELERRLAERIQHHPAFGYRRPWALLRRAGLPVNRKAQEAERALEQACLARFGTLRPAPRRSCAATTASSSRASASGRRAGTTG